MKNEKLIQEKEENIYAILTLREEIVHLDFVFCCYFFSSSTFIPKEQRTNRYLNKLQVAFFVVVVVYF